MAIVYNFDAVGLDDYPTLSGIGIVGVLNEFEERDLGLCNKAFPQFLQESTLRLERCGSLSDGCIRHEISPVLGIR
jgi:hypothetical protein